MRPRRLGAEVRCNFARDCRGASGRGAAHALARACSWPWRVTLPPRRERASARRPQDGMVLCPAACKRRPAADQTVRHWRRLAKQGLWCHTAGGGGSAAAIWRAFVYGRPECAAPAPTRPPGGDHETCSCCVCHARCCWTRLALWRAGVSAGRPAARRAAACRVLRAPHTGGPAGALRPTPCCTRAESYNTPVAAGVCEGTRG